MALGRTSPMNAKVALLLLGLGLGGVVGYLTRPQSAEIRIGSTSIEFHNNQVSTNSSGSFTTGQTQQMMLYGVIGAVIGLLVGFAVDRR